MPTTARLARPFAALALVAALAACGGGRRQVLVDPAVDLGPHSRIGLVLFTAENAKGDLPAFATQRFAERLASADPVPDVVHAWLPFSPSRG